MHQLWNAHREFWRVHPALLAGISLLISIGIFLFAFTPWLLLLWSAYLLSLQKWSSLVLSFLGGTYAALLYPPLNAALPMECTARFCISSLQRSQTPFHSTYLYKGTLYFEGKSLPCSITMPTSAKRPLASRDYWLEGTLIEREPFDYTFKPKRWIPIDNTWSMAELRFSSKEYIRSFLQSKLHRRQTALLLSSLATGEVEDRQLRYEFGRLGLQHILAISGFHFGVLLTFLSLFIGLLLSAKPKWLLMLLCTSTYFLLIGSSFAVERAWLAASLYLLGKLLRRRAEPLNLLGGAMLIELLLHPLAAANLGFHFSFGSCLGILLFYRPMEKFLRHLFPVRSLSEAISLSPLSQCAYLISSSFRKSIALTLSVNVTILPLLLYHFGRFPYLSLLYNLFIPCLVSIALFGLFIAFLAHLALGSWSTPLFFLLDWFTAQVLDLISYPPLCLDYSLYVPEFSPLIPVTYLALLFSCKLFHDARVNRACVT